MNTNHTIESVVYEAIKEINEQLPKEQQIPLNLESCLFDGNTGLDSISLVTLIITVEQNIQESFGKIISLADEKAMSQKNSPFKTVESLIEYTSNLVEQV